MWLGIDPDLTKDVRVPEEDGAPTFTIGFWPPLVAERLNLAMVRIRKIQGDDEEEIDLVKDFDKALQRSGVSIEAYQDMCRYGVRGWTGGVIEAELETEKIAGREHQVLSHRSVEVLYKGGLLLAVGLEAMRMNVLGETEKKRSDSPSSSATSTSPTPAPSATPTVSPAPSVEAISVSTGSPSPGARSSS